MIPFTGKQAISLQDFILEQTGGGCTALVYKFPNSNHTIVITDGDCNVPLLNDNDMYVGVYNDEDGWGQDLIASFSPVSAKSLSDTLFKAIKVVNKDLTLTAKVYHHTSLSAIQCVIVKYTYYPDIAAPETVFKCFNMSEGKTSHEDEDWTAHSMQETMHRILGHNNFTIEAIYT